MSGNALAVFADRQMTRKTNTATPVTAATTSGGPIA
jgi:hypothetical protein